MPSEYHRTTGCAVKPSPLDQGGGDVAASPSNGLSPCKRCSLFVGSAPMDATVLGLFLSASFIGGVTTGLAGFALALVVSGIWLHIMSPIQTVTLIVGYNLVTQSYAIWKLRHALSWRRLAPFFVGGAVGIPIGTMLLTYVDPAYLRTG